MTVRNTVCRLTEAADLDKGPVGIDLEILVRGDIAYDNDFRNFLREHGFNTTLDSSVSGRVRNLEQYYEVLELISEPPKLWSALEKDLLTVLSFLKREDDVAVLRSANADYTHVTPITPVFPKMGDVGKRIFRSKKLVKTLKLARGRVPSNFSGATHFHFDAASWFSSAEHARNLINILNQLNKDIPKHVPSGRYARPGAGGDFHASTREMPAQNWKTKEILAVPSAKKYLTWLSKTPGFDRYMALNIMPVSKDGRGDVEFRFLHSTLNINTISGWFKTIAEILIYAEKHETGDWDRFGRHASQEAPEVEKFISQQRARAQKSKDPEQIQAKPTKAMQRHFVPGAQPQPFRRSASNTMWTRQIRDPGNDVAAIKDTLWWISDVLPTADGDVYDMLVDAQTELEARLARLQTGQTHSEGLQEAKIPNFNNKIVLFLGDGSRLVISRGGNRLYINGAIRAWAGSIPELEMMLRDVIAERGGIRRTWIDPQ